MVKLQEVKIVRRGNKLFKEFTKGKLFGVFERSKGSLARPVKTFKTQKEADKFALKIANKSLVLREKQPKRRRRIFFVVKITGIAVRKL